MQVLTEYTELLSSSNNFSNYRRALHKAKNGFRIPILYESSLCFAVCIACTESTPGD